VPPGSLPSAQKSKTVDNPESFKNMCDLRFPLLGESLKLLRTYCSPGSRG
jgi:hypothetical protein